MSIKCGLSLIRWVFEMSYPAEDEYDGELEEGMRPRRVPSKSCTIAACSLEEGHKVAKCPKE